MSKRVCILGAGRQGTAAGYDLMRFLPDCDLTFADIDIKQAVRASERIEKLLGKKTSSVQIDLMNSSELSDFLLPFDIFLSSVPYKFNIYLTDIAINTKTSMVDLYRNNINHGFHFFGVCRIYIHTKQ